MKHSSRQFGDYFSGFGILYQPVSGAISRPAMLIMINSDNKKRGKA